MNRAEVTPRIDWGLIVYTIINVVLIILAACLLWWIVQLAEQSGSDSKFVMACITFAGTVCATIVTITTTFATALLKRPLDERNMRLKEVTELRKQNAEQRQDVETIVRSVALLGTDDGMESGKSQQVGALFALAHHRQLPMALCLLETLWRERQLSSYSACWLLDRAIRVDNEDLQYQAAEILLDHTDLLLTNDKNCQWIPSVDWDWPETLSEKAKPVIMQALFGVLMERNSPTEWDPDVLVNFCYLANKIADKEKEAETITQKTVLRAAAHLMLMLLEFVRQSNLAAGRPEPDTIAFPQRMEQIPDLIVIAEDVLDAVDAQPGWEKIESNFSAWAEN